MINIDIKCEKYNININNIIKYSKYHKIAFLLAYHDESMLNSVENKDKYIVFNGKRNDIFNKFFSEFSMFRYFYDKIDYLSEYICTNHYRRTFNKNENIYLNKLHPNVCICYRYMKISDAHQQNINSHGLKGFTGEKWYNCKWLYNDFKEYLINTNQYYYKFVDDYIYNNYTTQIFYSNCCFIMHKEKFKLLCEFVLGCFDYIINKYNLCTCDDFTNFIESKYKDKYDNGFRLPFHISYKSVSFYRLFAYFGEWLVSIFITANFEQQNIILNDNIKYE